jgi:hypothetical protein
LYYPISFCHIVECTLLTSYNCAPGVRVERGKAWTWGDEDSENGKPGYGTITNCDSGGHIGAAVTWDNGKSKMYSVDEMDNLCRLIFI